MYSFHLRPNLTGAPMFVDALLTPEECRSVVAFGERSLTMRVAKTEDHTVHANLRKSEISWIGPDGEHRWLFDRLRDCINDLNTNWFGFDLIGFEGIQFTKYAYTPGVEGDFYSSHKDTATLPGGTVRKLSFTLQLSPPESYGGGDVLLYNSLIDTVTLNRAVGSATFFSAYTIHEVQPVLRGVRYSLVGWAYGPAFR